MMVCAVVRNMRTVTEECMKWCNQRIVFGKKLIEQPVIRAKYVSSLPIPTQLNSAQLHPTPPNSTQLHSPPR